MENEKHAGGRPPKYSDPDELQRLVDEYFTDNQRVTLGGLAVHLGMDRKSLYNYKNRDKFFHIIKGARDKVEAWYEERAIYEGTPTGVIFSLKNMGWSDKQEIKQDNTGDMNINITRKTI